MQAGALAAYQEALSHAHPLSIRTTDGRTIGLDVRRWLAPVDAVDRTVLDRCHGPTLDVGCGPGRFVTALAAAGHIALGVDIAAAAVDLTTSGGAPALLRSVFDRVPGEGRWSTVLLMDGNIGIDADPARLLGRLRNVLAPDGRVLIETEPDAAVDDRVTVRFWLPATRQCVGPQFRWALVGQDALLTYATSVGYTCSETWSSDGRSFACLVRRSRITRRA
jgi:SAM-dependent methyltransferase